MHSTVKKRKISQPKNKTKLLFNSIENEKYEDIENILNSGGDPNTIVKKWGVSIFHLGVSNNMPPWVTQLMISYGADTQSRDVEPPHTAVIHDAIVEDNLENVNILLSNGVDINIQDDDGNTPLHMAASNGLDDIVQLLLQKGADIDIKNKYGKTPLELASNQQTKQTLVSFILQHDFNSPLPQSKYEQLPSEMVYAITRFIKG